MEDKPGKTPWYEIDWERINARAEPFYQLYRASGGDEELPTFDKSDVKEFIKSQPIQGARLRTLNTIGNICGIAASVGGIGTWMMSYRYSKSLGLPLLGGLLGASASALVADDICSWAYGTWKFDALATREAFAEWIIQRKLAEAEGELPVTFERNNK